MAGRDTILTLMLRDHGEILKLLNVFKKSVGGDSKAMVKAFDRFNWQLERHMFVEERVIFKKDLPISNDSYGMVQKVLDDHKMISSMLNEIGQALGKKSKIDTLRLEKFLVAHKNMEEIELYPRLEDELNPALKAFMVDQIKTRIF